MEGTWTIAELAERAVRALSASESVRVDGRVRDMPNERLIRWYTTIGLVDPPLGRRGRTALYGPRHLLQLVAVKRRQAAGRTIAQIQAELAGATDGRLREIAHLPERPPGPTEAPGSPSATEAPAAASPPDTLDTLADTEHARTERDRFWARSPAPTADIVTSADVVMAPEPHGGGDRASLVQGVRLAPGVTVMLEAAALDDDDLAAIETAAGPLLVELRRRGLTGPGPFTQTDPMPADPPGRPL